MTTTAQGRLNVLGGLMPSGIPLEVVAVALGVEPGQTPGDGDGDGCECAVCGDSRFPPFGPAKRSLGPLFSRWTLLRHPGAESVCVGCKAVLGGRPGRQPPPLRMVSFRCPVDAPAIEPLDRPAMWSLLAKRPGEPAVVSWAQSRKKHHAVFAGVSAGGVWRIGADEERIEWTHDPELLPAVERLRSLGCPKGAIVSGRYPPRLLAKAAIEIGRCERVLSRHRGPVLDLVAWAAPSGSGEIRKISEEETTMALKDEDARAVALVGTLAWGSEMRATEGLRFWGGFYLARLNRFKRLPLADFVSRLGAECAVSAAALADAGRMVIAMDREEEAMVSAAIRARTDLIHALALDDMARRRGGTMAAAHEDVHEDKRGVQG